MSPSSKAEDIEATAAAWFERREWTDWDAAAGEALEAWLSESTAHRIAFLRLEAAWKRAERLKALGAGTSESRVPARALFGLVADESAVPPIEATTGTSPLLHDKGSSIRFKWTIGGATVAALLALVVWYQSVGRWQTYGTPMGTIAPVALADGSRITLDSDTQLQVDLEAGQRRVRLDRGKALFEVAKDPVRPLTVEVADKRVTAVGTEFLVQRNADDIMVLVKEGRVRVQGEQHLVANPPIELAAGDRLSTHGDRRVVEQLDVHELERALSWREGYLEFQDVPLPQVIAEFNRYRTQKIAILDPRINSIRIGGRFRCTDANAFLALLQQGFPVAVTRDGNNVSLYQR